MAGLPALPQPAMRTTPLTTRTTDAASVLTTIQEAFSRQNATFAPATQDAINPEIQMADKFTAVEATITREITEFERDASETLLNNGRLGAPLVQSLHKGVATITKRFANQSAKAVAMIKSDLAAINGEFECSNPSSRATKKTQITETISRCLQGLEHEIHEIGVALAAHIARQMDEMKRRQTACDEAAADEHHELYDEHHELVMELQTCIDEKLEAAQWQTEREISQLRLEIHHRIESLEERIRDLEEHFAGVNAFQRIAQLENSQRNLETWWADLECRHRDTNRPG